MFALSGSASGRSWGIDIRASGRAMSARTLITPTLAEMVLRIGIAAVLLVVAVVIATIGNRRKKSSLVLAHRSYDYPRQVERSDFDRADAQWLVIVFSSAVCDGCALVVAKALVLESNAVAVVDCDFIEHKELHARYAIEGVPTTVIADSDGVVLRGFIGAVSATDLWAAMADLRFPPTQERVCLGHDH